MNKTSTHETGSENTLHPRNLTPEHLHFQLGSVEHGIDILKVREICGFESSRHLFNAPVYVSGMLNIRDVSALAGTAGPLSASTTTRHL